MKDTDLRGLVLKHFYSNRRGCEYLPSASDVGAPAEITNSDILHICDQLGEHNLIQWRPLKNISGIYSGSGKINASGIDVVEGVAKSPISIHFDNSQKISVSGSSNVTISGSNTQENTTTLINDQVSEIFNQVRDAVSQISDPVTREKIGQIVIEMQQEHGSSGFLQKYQEFISSAANHMTILAPVIPALTSLLT